MATCTTKKLCDDILFSIIHGVTFNVRDGGLLSNFLMLKFTLYCGLLSIVDIDAMVLKLFMFLSSLMSLLSQLQF
jgi:hypothetical protein